jgi:hypothetical protein
MAYVFTVFNKITKPFSYRINIVFNGQVDIIIKGKRNYAKKYNLYHHGFPAFKLLYHINEEYRNR